jgi:epoxyqueuosine reductase QueG
MCAPRRIFDREYTRAPRRLRDDPDLTRIDEVAAEAFELAHDQGAEAYATVSAEWIEDWLDLTSLLPDARAAVVFAMPYSQEAGPVAARAAHAWAEFLELDLARLLQRHGYSALPRPGLDKARLSEAAGRSVGSAALGCVVTSAPFITQASLPLEPDPVPTVETLTSVLSTRLTVLGAHLVGVADAEELQAAVPALRKAFDEEALRVHVRDAGPTHGATRPVIEPKPLPVIKGPQDHLSGAQSVLVLGLHHPLANLTLAGEPPAASVGPYAYATYQTVRELEYLGWEAARRLSAWGYRAVIVPDLCGTASQVLTPRGLQPDALSSRFAAVAAGLATIGWHGAPITPQYGVTQRFISVVTDAPLTSTGPRGLDDPCDGCDRPCVEACPVGAISTEASVSVDGQALAPLDGLRCDWAKKYGFVAAEGPGLMGQTTGIPPPAGPISAEQIAAAMARKDPVQRHWTCVVERCLQACQRKLGSPGR